jgi:hypothetical protein
MFPSYRIRFLSLGDLRVQASVICYANGLGQIRKDERRTMVRPGQSRVAL